MTAEEAPGCHPITGDGEGQGAGCDGGWGADEGGGGQVTGAATRPNWGGEAGVTTQTPSQVSLST